ncbi:hypothetical protein ACRALDRAFT_1077491 [Sodiomyces alcalophilus JCM 7366]|uniref:uncharacterized protein n=1 Tax=Sodiomyces alcalophilus JCM 7366 TaxID=591952 RepID=UPI0039B41C31
MPPKSSRAGHDDGKSEPTNAKEKTSSGSNHSGNTKGRRGANSAAAQAKEASTRNANTKAATKEEPQPPRIDWNSFDREALHTYCRENHLSAPVSFSNSYRQMVLSQPGSVGLHSPTMARRREERRQGKDKLALLVRKHFNGVGIQENDVIVDFIHKVRCRTISKADRMRRPPPPFDLER